MAPKLKIPGTTSDINRKSDLSERLIAGPGLAAATVEPHEFLDFVSGKLDHQFIDNPETLARRISNLDTQPDFDSRLRVNDFFCHVDTW